MKSKSQIIPEYLIYEVYNGKPIHYRNYREVMNGKKQFDQIMGSSYIQSLIISNLFFLLKSNLSSDFVPLTSEVGLTIDKKSRRAADIAIFEKSQLKNLKDPNKYLKIPPKYVVEVDIKASSDDIEDATSYYHKKTDELLDFGVEVVVWIFTESQKIMIASKESSDWKITNWDTEFSVIEGIPVNLKEIMD
jgi:Uma2 family endonuclease